MPSPSAHRPSDPITGVLMLHHGLGDIIMALPCLRVLQNSGAGRFLVVVRDAGCAQLAALYGGADAEFDLLILDRKKPVRTALRLRRRRPRWFIAPLNESWQVRLFGWLTGAKQLVLPPPSGAAEVPRHKVKCYLEVVHRAGFAAEANPLVRLPVSAKEREAARQLVAPAGQGRRWVVLAPGSGPIEVHKRWPAERFAELARRIVAAHPDCDVLVTGTASEAELVNAVVSQAALGDRVRRVPATDLPTLLGLYEQVAGVVTNCNGASHLAAAVGAPIVGLYGPTNPGFTGPYAERLWAVHRGLACAACYRAGFNAGCGQPVCMTRLEVEPVMNAVEAMLAGRPAPPVPWISTKQSTRPIENAPVPGRQERRKIGLQKSGHEL